MATVLVPEVSRQSGGILKVFPEVLRRVDPDVRDVILIGSAVYAPDLARDYDLVVTTASARDWLLLMESIAGALNDVSDKNVDVIIRHPGDTIGDLARAILAGYVLWGPGDQTKREARYSFGERGGIMNSFGQARDALENAEQIMKRTETTEKPGVKDRVYRNSFNELFDAARIAALTYLGRDDTVWSGVVRELPWPCDNNFRDMIKNLHIWYSYDGNYPKDPGQAAEEFANWKNKVEDFINDLEARIVGKPEPKS